MNETCGMCDQPADVTIGVHVDDVDGTFPTCRTHMLDTLATIAATVDLCADHPYDKAITRLERKQRAGTANDTDLTDLVRYRRLREDAKHRHPSGRTT
jgi:hypothetical protein